MTKLEQEAMKATQQIKRRGLNYLHTADIPVDTGKMLSTSVLALRAARGGITFDITLEFATDYAVYADQYQPFWDDAVRYFSRMIQQELGRIPDAQVTL